MHVYHGASCCSLGTSCNAVLSNWKLCVLHGGCLSLAHGPPVILCYADFVCWSNYYATVDLKVDSTLSATGPLDQLLHIQVHLSCQGPPTCRQPTSMLPAPHPTYLSECMHACIDRCRHDCLICQTWQMPMNISTHQHLAVSGKMSS